MSLSSLVSLEWAKYRRGVRGVSAVARPALDRQSACRVLATGRRWSHSQRGYEACGVAACGERHVSQAGFDGDSDLARFSRSRDSGIRRRSIVVGGCSRTRLV